MKRFALAVTLTTVLLLRTAPAAHAGASAFVGSTEFSALAGHLSLGDVFVPADEDSFFAHNPTVTLKGGFLWGVRLGHRFTRRFETEATLGYGSGEVQQTRNGVTTKVTGLRTVVYNLNALYYIPFFGQHFEPYVAAGVGGTSYRPSSVARLDRTSSLTGNAGGGARVYLSNKLAIRGDARVYTLSFDRNTFFRRYPNFSRQLDKKTLTHTELTLGLSLRFFDTDLF